MSTQGVEVPGLALARNLFQRGTDCLGPEEIMHAFGVSLAPAPEDIPPIPLSETMLTHLRMLGMCLELHGPSTMRQLYDVLGNELDQGKLLCNTNWYKNEPFYTTEKSPNWHWRVTLKGLVPDSTSKKYLPQTRVLADYLKVEVFTGQPLPKALVEAVTELNDRETELAKLMDENWRKVAEELAGLQLNQLCRGTAAQSLWGIALHKKVNGEYLLPGVWDWTKSRSSFGHLVNVGYADGDGVHVADDIPRSSYSHLGVRFSFSAEDLAT